MKKCIAIAVGLMCCAPFAQAQDSLRGKALGPAEIELKKDNDFGITRLKQVEGTSIYAGKKSEVIVLNDVQANIATNNSRQVYAKVAGLNVWESDGAGIQLGIGGRGLNPNRVSNFNTRQNGYDISADALGYPESYYTPPTEALERIEIVRGAASLQYGTQFGGFVNFRFKQGPTHKKIELTARQSMGSYRFYNAFTSLGGTVKKVNYYAFYQYKTGKGWRPNAGFNVHTAFTGVAIPLSKRGRLKVEYTYMDYLAQQPGGLTDRQFDIDPRQSNRSRNWFQVCWNLFATDLSIDIGEDSKFNWRTFGLLASRDALGNLGRIDRADSDKERDYLQDQFKNFGTEIRYLNPYSLNEKTTATFLVGMRYYRGHTYRKQGLGNAASTPDFYFLNPDNLEHSNYTFPSQNLAFFIENIFRFGKKLHITPGLRYEYIDTRSKGYYNEEYRDLAGNLLFQKRTTDNRENQRDFFLAGIGAGYKVSDGLEFYSNISQNYRSINFNDMRVVNPNFRVNPNLKDETGYSADIGFRGNKNKWLNFDLSLFYLKYRDRIGSVQKSDTVTYQIYRYRTNISDSRNLGMECFGEVNLYPILGGRTPGYAVNIFVNYAYINATYSQSLEAAVKEGNKVEYVPAQIIRTGISGSFKKFRGSIQYSYTAAQFTDATNATFTSSAVDGLIPSYSIVDFNLHYNYGRYSLSGNINNVLNHRYFTRRADGYPGPGIIPAEPRGCFVTLQVML
jgi:Fe(3+) dicitrate transport protein